MRTILVAVVSSVAVACHAPASHSMVSPSSETAMLERIVADSFYAAIGERDVARLGRIATAEFALVENDTVIRIDRFLAIVTSLPTTLKIRYALANFDTRIEGHVAWTTFYNTGTITRRDTTFQREWLETAILVRRNGAWRIDRLQSCELGRHPVR
jgi:hypothetical protein